MRFNTVNRCMMRTTILVWILLFSRCIQNCYASDKLDTARSGSATEMSEGTQNEINQVAKSDNINDESKKDEDVETVELRKGKSVIRFDVKTPAGYDYVAFFFFDLYIHMICLLQYMVMCYWLKNSNTYVEEKKQSMKSKAKSRLGRISFDITSKNLPPRLCKCR